MNLLMASVFLLAMLAFQPTLIYGTKKNLALVRNANSNGGANRNARSTKYGKRHSIESPVHPLYSPALSSTAKLVLSMDSGDEVLVRAVRGATVDNKASSTSASTIAGQSGTGAKRQKGNNNKKLNKNFAAHENGATSSSSPSASTLSSSSTSAAGRKHLEKKFSAASGGLSATAQQQQQQQQQQQASNGKGKQQRQMLKSHNHQGKRSGNNGGKAIRENAGESEKSPACRYSKSVWSECDTKTNMRSRTLNLKKGDASCQPTRTMQKKCKKSCRYEKGAWSECINGQMTREDKLKATGGVGTESLSSSCEPLRTINKKCNPNNGAGSRSGSSSNKQAGGSGGSKKERKNKDKGSRRNQSQPPQ